MRLHQYFSWIVYPQRPRLERTRFRSSGGEVNKGGQLAEGIAPWVAGIARRDPPSSESAAYCGSDDPLGAT